MKINELLIPYYTYDEQKYNWKYIESNEIKNIINYGASNEIIYNGLGVLLYERYREYIDEYICNNYGDYTEWAKYNYVAITDPDELKAFTAFEWVDNLAMELI